MKSTSFAHTPNGLERFVFHLPPIISSPFNLRSIFQLCTLLCVQDTDRLFALCQQYDLRFVVIEDRFNPPEAHRAPATFRLQPLPTPAIPSGFAYVAPSEAEQQLLRAQQAHEAREEAEESAAAAAGGGRGGSRRMRMDDEDDDEGVGHEGRDARHGGEADGDAAASAAQKRRSSRLTDSASSPSSSSSSSSSSSAPPPPGHAFRHILVPHASNLVTILSLDRIRIKYNRKRSRFVTSTFGADWGDSAAAASVLMAGDTDSAVNNPVAVSATKPSASRSVAKSSAGSAASASASVSALSLTHLLDPATGAPIRLLTAAEQAEQRRVQRKRAKEVAKERARAQAEAAAAEHGRRLASLRGMTLARCLQLLRGRDELASTIKRMEADMDTVQVSTTFHFMARTLEF